MVSIIDRLMTAYRGLSTDEKPKAYNGSVFFEMDTGKAYYYDGEHEEWIQPGGGSGGGASSNLVDVGLVGSMIVG